MHTVSFSTSQQQTDFVVNTINNKVATLPPLDDMSTRVGSAFSQKPSRDIASRALLQLPSRTIETKSERPVLHPSVYHDSPGQNVCGEPLFREIIKFKSFLKLFQMQKNLTLKALLNPENLFNRNILNRSYGINLPPTYHGRRTKV